MAAARRINRRTLPLALAAAISTGATSASADEEEVLTVVAFGDSLVAGFGLDPQESFAPQLETWLAENGVVDVTVVNAGVSGDTTSGGLARLDWSIGPEADAVILERRARSSVENGRFSARLARKRGLRSALLVSDERHLAYAVPVFRDAYEEEGVKLYWTPVDYARVRSSGLGLHPDSAPR